MRPTLAQLAGERSTPVVLADHDGLITYVNEPFVAFTGWAPADVVGKPLTTIIPRAMHDAHNLGFSRFLTTGEATLIGKPLDLQVVARDGRLLASRHLIVAEREGDRWRFGALIQP